MNDSLLSRITPWVGRLLVINAVVLLLQQTIVTSDVLASAIEFDPLLASERPWSFLTYMFAHRGLVHLLANSLALFVFGPTVERRFGSAVFIIYYIYCGLGAAIVSLVASLVGFDIGAFVGASGAVLGVMFAFARILPDAELLIFPIPMPIKARHLIMLVAAIDVLGAVAGNDSIAHVAHLGGLASGWLFFALQGIARPIDPPRLPSMRPRVAVAHRETGGTSAQLERSARAAPSATAPAATATATPDPVAIEAAEVDRLLDKIIAAGFASLTEMSGPF